MKGKISKMMLGMAACCLVPVLIAFIVPALGIASGNKLVSYIVPFLCPLMMIGMMLFMGGMGSGHKHGDHSCCGVDKKQNNAENQG